MKGAEVAAEERKSHGRSNRKTIWKREGAKVEQDGGKVEQERKQEEKED